MLDAYIVDRMRREKERAKARETRVPLSIEPPPPPDARDLERPQEENENDRPKRGVVVVDFTLESDKGPQRHARLRPEQVLEDLRAGGLTAEIARESLPDQYVVVGTKK